MLSVTTTQRLRKRRVGSPAQLGLQSLLVASPLSAAVSLAVPFLFRHASTNHHGRIWPCVIRRPTRAGGHAIGDVFVTDCVCCKTSDLAYLYTSCNRRTRRSRRRLAVLRPSASHATVRLSKADSLYRACPGANGAESEVRRAWWYSRSNTFLLVQSLLIDKV